MKMKWLSVLTALLCFAATATGQGRGFMYSVSTEVGNNFRKNTGFSPIDVAFTPGYAFDGRFFVGVPPHPLQRAVPHGRHTELREQLPDGYQRRIQHPVRSRHARIPQRRLRRKRLHPIPPVALLRPVCEMGHFRLLQTARRTRSTLLPVARQHRQRPSLPLRQHRVPLQLTSPRTFAAGCRFVTAPCLP